MWLASVRDHTRFPLVRRASHSSSQRLDSIGGEIVIACACALLAAVWQGTHETQTHTHLLIAVSVGDLALAGLIGALGGLLLVRGCFFLFELARYPLSGHKDRRWEVGVGLGSMPGAAFLLIASTRKPPINPESLGDMECLVIDPSGKEERIPDRHLSIERYEMPLVSARYGVKLTGIHEIRWYGSTHRGGLYEIARGRCELQAPGDLPAGL
jgi:hypothetical protein